jgi:hypothetical protein
MPRVILGTIVLCTLASACGSSPTTPSGEGPVTYDGEWSGTTSQGRPISFVISPSQKVTAITVGYNFNGCSGVSTFSNLTLDIGSPPNPTAPTLGPGFGFGSGPPDGPNYTQVYGSFTSNVSATGSVVFGGYSGCGNAGAIFSASRR